MTNQPSNEQSRRRLWQRIAFTATLIVSAATVASSSNIGNESSNIISQTLTTSQHNLLRPTHPTSTTHRSLTLNSNLINYQPSNLINYQPSNTASSGYTQTELLKISQQEYGAPHTGSWTQCPKSYLGYRASYDCTAYIYCTNGKMKEEGYVKCQEGLRFDNVGGLCVWEVEMTCDPEEGQSVVVGATSDENMVLMGEDASGTTSTTNTYSKRMNSVTSNPRYQDASSNESASQWSGGAGDWGGYWENGKWIEETDSTSSSSSTNTVDENVEIFSWSKEDVTSFPLPQLQPYDLAQKSSSTEETSLPREFISQEGWSTQTRRQHNNKKVIGYYTNWQWYANQERASPVNMQFSKLDRVVFAFFQMSEGGEIWGVDDWADGGILL